MKTVLNAGSRESPLALVQTRLVVEALQQHDPQLEIALKTYKTQGDLILETSLSQLGDKGVFIKELETALLAGEIDFAVHSMKDMPSEQPEGLYLFPFGARETPFDVLVSKSKVSFLELPTGAVIGTSSLRREAVLKKRRPDLYFQLIRGNVQTRLRKLEEGPYDAIVLAAAGLHRLGLEHLIHDTFLPQDLLPACCQGTLAVEVANSDLMERFRPFVDTATEVCTVAERSFLRAMQGGCQIPMGAYAWPVEGNRYQIRGMVCDPQDLTLITEEVIFSVDQAFETGKQLAHTLLNQGGQLILEKLLHP